MFNVGVGDLNRPLLIRNVFFPPEGVLACNVYKNCVLELFLPVMIGAHQDQVGTG
jgi:hypothetical protein